MHVVSFVPQMNSTGRSGRRLDGSFAAGGEILCKYEQRLNVERRRDINYRVLLHDGTTLYGSNSADRSCLLAGISFRRKQVPAFIFRKRSAISGDEKKTSVFKIRSESGT